jgi:hypothetical protein
MASFVVWGDQRRADEPATVPYHNLPAPVVYVSHRKDGL